MNKRPPETYFAPMDTMLRAGFSEDQLRGVDLHAVAMAYGQDSNKRFMPESIVKGVTTTKELFQEMSAAKEPTSFSQDIKYTGHLSEELEPTSANPNGHQGTQPHTATVVSPLSALEHGVMPIAIVGMSCRFPGGASDIRTFWELVSKGRSAWSEIPESRFNVDAFYHPDWERTDTVSFRALFGLAWRKNGWLRV